MNGIEYTPHKGDSPLAAQARCQADFTYTMSPDVIGIVDLDSGGRSVTNDIERVLRQIEYWHEGSIKDYRIMYRDSEGVWDGVHWDGQRASFFCPSRDGRSFSQEETSEAPGAMNIIRKTVFHVLNSREHRAILNRWKSEGRIPESYSRSLQEISPAVEAEYRRENHKPWPEPVFELYRP